MAMNPPSIPRTPACYRQWLAEQMAAFEDVVSRADLDARVPWAGRWRLRNVAEHLASVHRWAAEAVSTGKRPRLWPKGPPGLDVGELYQHASATLLRALDEADPDAPCWGFGPEPRLESFWFRRQTQETAIHLWDARAASGDDTPIDPLIAADGIDEAFAVMLPRRHKWRKAELPHLPGPVDIVTLDTGHRWRFDPRPDNLVPAITAFPSADDEPLALVSGRAQALDLWLWGRLPPETDQVSIAGDRASITAFVSAGLTP
jgi:uncharacterized protein (TIGR03083 family)